MHHYFIHVTYIILYSKYAAAAAAKLLQSCPTLQPHGQQSTRILYPQDSTGKNTGMPFTSPIEQLYFNLIRHLWKKGQRPGGQTLGLKENFAVHKLYDHLHSKPQFVSSSVWEHSRNVLCMHTKSLQSCPTLCDSIDSSPPDSSVPGILQARTLEWVAISFSNACMHAK